MLKRQRSVIETTTPSRPQKRARFAKRAPRKTPTLRPEKKFFDSFSVSDCTDAGAILNLNNMAQGDTVFNRDANKVLCTSVQLRGSFTMESTTVNAIVRYLVIHDKNANGTAPTLAQVFSEEITGANVMSMKSVPNASRFTTLLDKTAPINATTGTATAFQKFTFDHYIKIPAALQTAQYATNATAVPISGSLSLIFLSDRPAGATDVDTSIFTRTRFIG